MHDQAALETSVHWHFPRATFTAPAYANQEARGAKRDAD